VEIARSTKTAAEMAGFIKWRPGGIVDSAARRGHGPPAATQGKQR
jgi:hypothetical protein